MTHYDSPEPPTLTPATDSPFDAVLSPYTKPSTSGLGGPQALISSSSAVLSRPISSSADRFSSPPPSLSFLSPPRNLSRSQTQPTTNRDHRGDRSRRLVGGDLFSHARQQTNPNPSSSSNNWKFNVPPPMISPFGDETFSLEEPSPPPPPRFPSSTMPPAPTMSRSYTYGAGTASYNNRRGRGKRMYPIGRRRGFPDGMYQDRETRNGRGRGGTRNSSSPKRGTRHHEQKSKREKQQQQRVSPWERMEYDSRFSAIPNKVLYDTLESEREKLAILQRNGPVVFAKIEEFRRQLQDDERQLQSMKVMIDEEMRKQSMTEKELASLTAEIEKVAMVSEVGSSSSSLVKGKSSQDVIPEEKPDDESDDDEGVMKLPSFSKFKDEEEKSATQATESEDGDFFSIPPPLPLMEFESEKPTLEKDLEGLVKQNTSLQAAVDAIHDSLTRSHRKLEDALSLQHQRRADIAEKNRTMESKKMELTDHVAKLREQLDHMRASNAAKMASQQLNLKRNMFFQEENETTITRDLNDDDGKATESRENENGRRKRNGRREKKNGTTAMENQTRRASSSSTASGGNPGQQQQLSGTNDTLLQLNLVRAQIEFYFSDYNLKRDKKMLQTLLSSDPPGFMDVEEVLSLNRVKQLCGNVKALHDAMKSSECLVFSDDKSQLGRANFSKPREKQFPFRRTVFLYGVPWNADVNWVYAFGKPFGVIEKIEFDHGPDTVDRLIASKMMNRSDRPKIYKCMTRETCALEMTYVTELKRELDGVMYACSWCNKKNQTYDEGFYCYKKAKGKAPCRVCLQCAAGRAEEQCKLFEKGMHVGQKGDGELRMLLCGVRPRRLMRSDGVVPEDKTALVVFSSQRQASKCVYVRSRLAFMGTFATHYHHYSKMKREIVSEFAKERLVVGGMRKREKMEKMRKMKSVDVEVKKDEEDVDEEREEVERGKVKRVVSAPVFDDKDVYL